MNVGYVSLEKEEQHHWKIYHEFLPGPMTLKQSHLQQRIGSGVNHLNLFIDRASPVVLLCLALNSLYRLGWPCI